VSDDFQRSLAEARAEAKIDAIEHELDYAERGNRYEPYHHAELARMEGGRGEGRWR
jgi:hypothetical protein